MTIHSARLAAIDTSGDCNTRVTAYSAIMAQRRTRGTPLSFVRSGSYPDCVFQPDAPASVHWAGEVARRLNTAISAHAVSDIAARAGLARSTIYDIMAGRTWPDLASIVQLQAALGVTLWPDWPPDWQPPV